MISQAEAVPLAGGASASWSTAYTYDGANRLATAAEGSAWLLSYGYDRFGNVSVADPNGVQYGGLSCPSYDATTNRCNGAGFGYDNGPGNLTTFPGSRTAVYDAENRQISLTDGGTTQYVYDGEGRRVQKVAGGQTTTYVYDATGQLAAEYGGATDPSGCTRCYLTVDHLGSTRLVTDAATGNVMRRYDYLPFGGEINSSWGQRSTVTGYVMSDGMEPKFTGKERDYESSLGLDYFGARYFSGAQGRFTTADPMLNSAKPGDPQTWNRYAYGLNNPLKFVDPNGLYNLVNTCDAGDKKCNKQFEQYAGNLKQGLADLQTRVDKMKNGAEKDRLVAALGAMGTENDKNNVNVQFGPTDDGAAAQTNPFYNEQTGKLGFNVIIDPLRISGGTNDWGIDAAHEGTHVADIGDPRYANPATTLSPFSLEYRGYQTSSWAASALGLPSLSYGNGRYQIWNSSWGVVDKTLTNFITSMKDCKGLVNRSS